MIGRKIYFWITWHLTSTPGPANIHIANIDEMYKTWKGSHQHHNGEKWLPSSKWIAGCHSVANGIHLVGHDEQYVEDHVEDVINHESLHSVLHKHFGYDISKALDNVQVWSSKPVDRIVFKKLEEV